MLEVGPAKGPPNDTVRVRSLTKTYRERHGADLRALSEIDIELRAGEIVALVGPSGCGKTTLLKLIAGLLVPDRGEILIHGRPVLGPGSDRCLVFQDDNLFPWKMVQENVEFGLKAAGVPKESRRRLAREAIALVQLDGFEDRYPRELSTGMRQRVAIARALVLDPPCLLLDEPFAALDAQLRRQLQNEFLGILQSRNTAVLFVTHDTEEAIYIADRVLVLTSRPGRIAAILAVGFPRPRSPELRVTPEFALLRSLLERQLCEGPPRETASADATSMSSDPTRALEARARYSWTENV
jgi:NitT/TauT family transport system ATP-binding protein